MKYIPTSTRKQNQKRHGYCLRSRGFIPLTTSSSSSTSRRLRPLFHQTPILQHSQCMSHVTDLADNKTWFNPALYQRTHKTKLNCSADKACNYSVRPPATATATCAACDTPPSRSPESGTGRSGPVWFHGGNSWQHNRRASCSCEWYECTQESGIKRQI